jgi:hypothetical protein
MRRSQRTSDTTSATAAALPWMRSPRALVLGIIIAGVVGRLVLAQAVGLGVDESYAVSVSRPLSLSYFEHPPLSFWIPGVIGALAGTENRLLLRLPFILAFAGTTWMMYRLGARLFGERAGAIAALILNVAPVFSLTTGSWILPDGPLMFWMLAATLCLERVVVPHEGARRDGRWSTWWWLAAGLCAGLALLSKYHGIFLLAGTGLFLLTSPSERRWFRHPGPYLGAAVAALLFSPVLIWNARHGWISFRFQGGRGAPNDGLLHFGALLQNIAGQLGYLLPWILIPLAWVLGSVVFDATRAAVRSFPESRTRHETAQWLLACLAIGPIATFTLLALRGNPGLPHWQAPGWLMAIPLLAAAVDVRLVRGAARTRRRTRRWLVASTIAFLLIAAVAATQTTNGWLSRVAPALFAHGDPTLEAVDWRDLPAAISPALRSTAQPFVAASSWIDAGKIAYALGGRADVVCLCAEPHQFAFIHSGASFLARDAVIVERVRDGSRSTTSLAPYFRGVEPLGTTVVRRAGHPAITLALFRGEKLIATVPLRAP